MDAILLHIWAQNARRVLRGATITGGSFLGPTTVVLALGEDRRLTISLARSAPAIFLEERPPAKKRLEGLPGAFVEAVFGARIESVDPIEAERVVRLTLGREGEEPGTAIVVELVPARSAIIALAHDRIACVVTPKRREGRFVTGEPYAPPPAPEGIRYPGVDRRIGAALDAERAGSWRELIDHARAKAGGSAHIHVEGTRVLVSPVALPMPAAALVAPPEDLDDAIRIAHTIARRIDREAEVARSRARRFRTLRKKLRRALDAAGRDLARAEEWPLDERRGTALLARPDLLERGAHEARLPDPFDPDGPAIVVAVDPALTLHANAASYMKRARRGKRRVERARARRDSLSADLASIETLVDRPPADWTPDDHKTLETLFVRHRVPEPPPEGASRARARGPRAQGPDDGFHPRRFRSSDGWLILVGRSNEENDWLSLKRARQEDVWLHAHGVSGSHVLIKREGQKDNPPKRTLEEAAALAAHYSKAKHAGAVPVVYTKAKYVRKPRKSPPGLVTCTREKTLMVRPADPKKMRRDDDGEPT